MSAEKSPAFQWYPRDFAAGTADMSDAEVGLYVRLLNKQWLDQSLPPNLEPEEGSDDSLVAGLPRDDIELRRASWRAIKKHFKPHPTIAGRIAQERLENVRAEQAVYRANQKRKSEKGVQARMTRGKPGGEPGGVPAGHPVVNQRVTQGLPTDDPNTGGGPPAGHPAVNPGLTPASAAATAAADTPPTPPGGTGEGTGRGEMSDAMKFGRWFFETGIALGAIDSHLAFAGPIDFAYKHKAASEGLVAAHPLDELQRRSQNLFARKLMAGPDRIGKAATPTFLAEHWSWFETAEAPGRRLTVVTPSRPAGAEDYDAILARRAEARRAQPPKVYTDEEQRMIAEM